MKIFRQFVILSATGLVLSSCDGGTKEAENAATPDEVKTAENKSEELAIWRAMQVKDEFGDIVDGKVTIAADFDGRMTNSVVANEKLLVRMQIQDSTIYTIFYEYGREPQAQLPQSKFLDIKVKLAGGDVVELQQFLYANMMVDNEKELMSILLNEVDPIKAIVDISRADKYDNRTYTFEIDPKGLKEVVR